MAGDIKPSGTRERVRLNIGGKLFQTSWTTLRAVPGNRLSELSLDDPAFDEDAGEFFFDRNAKMFAAVLEYHRTGQLHFPTNICVQSVLLELAFWRINEERLSPCCWVRVREYYDLCSTLRTINDNFGTDYTGLKCAVGGPNRGELTKIRSSYVKNEVWRCLEDPWSGKLGKVWLLLYSTMVILSIMNVCFWSQEADSAFASLMNTVTLSIAKNKTVAFYTQLPSTFRTLVIIEIITNTFFTLELLIRLCVCQSVKKLLCTSMTWVNFICICLGWFELGTYFFYHPPSFIRYIIIFDALRIFRLFNIFRHCEVWCVLWMAIRESTWEMVILAAFMGTGMLIFATLIFYAQFGSDAPFDTIPRGFWWAIVTMTTVGYGDAYPTTNTGYVVGGACALAGMLATGLPIPIISNNFNSFNRVCRLRRLYITRRREISKETGGTLPSEFQPGQDSLSNHCLGFDLSEKSTNLK